MLDTRISADGTREKHSHSGSGKITYPTTYAQVQSCEKTLSRYAVKPTTKTLCCGEVYDSDAFNEIFIKSLDALFRCSMCY